MKLCQWRREIADSRSCLAQASHGLGEKLLRRTIGRPPWRNARKPIRGVRDAGSAAMRPPATTEASWAMSATLRANSPSVSRPAARS